MTPPEKQTFLVNMPVADAAPFRIGLSRGYGTHVEVCGMVFEIVAIPDDETVVLVAESAL